MVVRCEANDCGRPAALDEQWRLVTAFNFADLLDLFGGALDARDCRFCGAKASVRPSLAALFIVENRLVLLDRGFDPEPQANEALAPFFAIMGEAAVMERTADLNAFKSRFAGLVKATAHRYPFTVLDASSLDDNLANWRALQGEIVTGLMAGALGVVPNFGVDAGHADGRVESRDYAVEAVKALVLQLLRCWLVGISGLSQSNPLEQLLLRLVDSCGAVAYVADEIIDLLTTIRTLIADERLDNWTLFHFHAVEASLFAMLKRTNPNVVDWAVHYLMIRCAARADPDNDDDRFLLSPRRVSATIDYQSAWDAVATVLRSHLEIAKLDEQADQLRILSEAADDLGYPGLFSTVWDQGLRVGARGGVEGNVHTPEALARIILDARARVPGAGWGTMLGAWHLPWFEQAGEIARLFDLLWPATQNDVISRADLLGWFGERMKHLGAPGIGLDRIGREPAEWEAELDNAGKRRLWTERSNMLRLIGEPVVALGVAEAVLGITLGQPDASRQNVATALLNCGILLRETGQFAEAVELLMEAIKVAPEVQRWSALQSLATTYLHMGRQLEAADLLSAVRQRAGGVDYRGLRIGLLVTEICVRFQLKQFHRVETLRRDLPAPADLPDEALLGYSTLLQIERARSTNPREFHEIGCETVARLLTRSNAFSEAGNNLQAQAHLRCAAALAQDLGLAMSSGLWLADTQASIEAGRVPDARTAVELAILDLDEIEMPDPAILWEHIDAILAALDDKAGRIALDTTTMNLLAPLDDAFKRLASMAHAKGYDVTEHQGIAEVRRNAHRRALRLEGDGRLGTRFATGKAMKADQATFVVLEWSDMAGAESLGLVSLMNPDGVRADYLRSTEDLDIFAVASAIGTRMPMWHTAREDEPFDVPGWDQVCRWLRHVAGSYMPAGGHVVIIDHPELAGLPFHIALAPTWTVSYASSWSAIEAAVVANGTASPRSPIGILHAPRANETVAVRDALARSAEATRELAADRKLPCDFAGPGTADADRLRGLLHACEVLKVLCHGQPWKGEHEIALVIDHDGRSPPGHSFSEAISAKNEHRFGREALSGIEDAARTVFLGACSAGVVSIGGLDERTSFSLLLADAGTCSVVAPRWKIDAEMALTVLDETVARFITGQSLKNAVGAAAEAAVARGVPAWQAYSFVIEGAWE